MNLMDVMDVVLIGQEVGKAKTEGLRRVVDKIPATDLDMIFRSVEVPQDAQNAIGATFREAIRRVIDEEQLHY